MPEKYDITIPDFQIDNEKIMCYGCEACVQICPISAIKMKEDKYGFRYPHIDRNICTGCGMCRKVCPSIHRPPLNANIASYGGYTKDIQKRRLSTSGGIFSALVQAGFNNYCDNIVVFGAVAIGLDVHHESADSPTEFQKFYSSKYVQSNIYEAFSIIHGLLKKRKYVIFSGTPCQVAGLVNFLKAKNTDSSKLFCIEVLCAGVATPTLFRKYDDWLKGKYGGCIKKFYWRYKDNDRWDYNCCMYELNNGKRRVIDRWFSDYWSLFTQRLLMRPSCESCPFKGNRRVADISLGDLWGVDREYPDLYDGNKGTSWILVNSGKGNSLFEATKPYIHFMSVKFDKMMKYQIPSISGKPFHPSYKEFMYDLLNDDYDVLRRKWVKTPTFMVFFRKYIWNNSARYYLWKLRKAVSEITRSHVKVGG